MKYRVVCIAQIYNELRKGNLERFVKYVMPLVDALVVYDDASTDGSYEFMLQQTPHVIRGLKNDFSSEMYHKQRLLDYALRLSADFILWLDADEVLTRNAQTRVQELCTYCIENDFDGISFHELNLWRSCSWRRIDSGYDDGWFVRLWRVRSGMSYGEIKRGLHQPPYPPSIQKVKRVEDVGVIHYGFASDRALAYKYLTYKAHGQSGWLLGRLLNEDTLRLEKVPEALFPEGLEVNDGPPLRRCSEEALRSIEPYRTEISAPGVSIICLIYRSTQWLDFIYEQVLRYTDLTNKEFFFVANDATQSVLRHLRDQYIPHVVWNNTPEQRRGWYINNVYRAYNWGARVARGDYLCFINSDMAFSPGWLERLFEKMDGKSCVTSRLVESGRLPSGEHAISRSFGQLPNEYDEAAFIKYAKAAQLPGTRRGGLFMPLLVRRDDFWRVGGYPEGNIDPDSDLSRPRITKQGEPCISGDAVLIQKLQRIGVEHRTALDSVVYHFQRGEQDDRVRDEPRRDVEPIIVCNDALDGSMGEKTLWGFLLEGLPGAVGVDRERIGGGEDLAGVMRRYIREAYPEARVIIQNASFLDFVDQDRFTIVYLQDNLRGMGKPSVQQERNLRLANARVSNSRLTAMSYPEFEFDIIPIGVDTCLFRPMDKERLRCDLDLPKGTVGIFVGDYGEVKGWQSIRSLVEKRKDIFWILVSKDQKTYSARNCRCYNRISQELLAKLYNCADFFIVGSPVESECLAAVEACFCGVPIVMRQTGIFADLTDEERRNVGVFGDDLEGGVDCVLEGTFHPREVVLKRGLAVEGMIDAWRHFLERTRLAMDSRREFVRYGTAAVPVASAITSPLVSIITPCYNQALYLEETIQSVLKQDYPHIEYIVLDDGSTDNTREILSHYTGRIVWESHPNMGEARTVNKGLTMAEGDILAVVNSDDPLRPSAVSSAVEFLQAHPDVLVAYPDWDLIGPDGEVIQHIQVNEYDFFHMLRRHHCTVGPGAFIRRTALDLVGGRDPQFQYVSDFDFWLRLGLHGRFARIPLTLATFRKHPGSATESRKSKQMAEEHVRVVEKLYSTQNLPEEVRRCRREAMSYAHFEAALCCGNEWRRALGHLLRSLCYYPQILLRQWKLLLALALPRRIYDLLRIARRKARAAVKEGVTRVCWRKTGTSV